MIHGTIERLPPIKTPGFDCRSDNANCPSCNARRASGRPADDHGVFGGSYFFGVATTDNGKRIGLSLEVFGIHYPPTVPEPIPAKVQTPHGAYLVVHRETDGDDSQCPFIGNGKHCETSTWSLILANEIYRETGVQTTDRNRDISEQPEALWMRLEELLVLEVHGEAKESA
jgi:hypothetical protein